MGGFLTRDCHVGRASSVDRHPLQQLLVPVLDVVLCLVRGMDSRLHPSSLVCPLATSLRIRAPTPQSARVLRRLEARRQIQTFAGSDEDWDARSKELSEEALENLRALGYIR